MPASIPLLAPSGQSAQLFPGRSAGSPGEVFHNMQSDAPLTGATVPMAGGSTNVHVGCLVLAALVGIILLHGAGFRFAVDAGIGSR